MSVDHNTVETDIVDIVFQTPEKLADWHPHIAEETLSLLENLKIPEQGKVLVKNEALSILSRCIPPDMPCNNTTGLVVGYVQSGKTMSFTTVATLACDNHYQLIIVITGISDPLFKQSTGRLKDDLNLIKRPDRKWQHFANPAPKDRVSQIINDILEECKDNTIAVSERQTILITVMKNHRHLKNLIQVLSKLNLAQVTTLIIDDEADQAGLNTLVKKGEESSTYKSLLQLRASLPHHSFLQYTATPQAPLLINLIDALSPDFAEVLTPGQDYVGGKEFFLDYPNLVSTIPESEIPTKDNEVVSPPESLLNAMRIFFLGVAAGLYKGQDKEHNRSMLVHPSQKTIKHGQYFHWVTQVRENWKKILELDGNDPDHQDLQQSFKAPYEVLQSTVSDLPTFEELISFLLRSIRKTRIEEVNSVRGKTPEIDWKAAYSHILVGGQAMDRGFTVEGLTVTYMPRGAGVGNADTVQQRARFFGYKKQYLGYCRVFLESVVRDAYRHYVEHEEDIRKQLLLLQKSRSPLSEWKRAFFLTKKLKPTRDNVLDLDYMRGNLSDAWFAPKAPHDSIEAIQTNSEIIANFLFELPPFNTDKGHEKRTIKQRHLVCTGVSLNLAYEKLLTQIRLTRANDTQKFVGVLLQIRNFIEKHPYATCTIYLMSRGQNSLETRERSLNQSDEIPNLFQGENPLGSGEIYPGDRLIRTEKEVTIQMHFLQVIKENEKGNEEIVAENVPAITVWIPNELSADWYIQQSSKN